MKHLSQFLYKLLLTILAGIFISISTFPGKVIAFDLSNTPPQYREQARQQEAQLRKPRLGARPGLPELGAPEANQLDANGCPLVDNQPDFSNPLFIPSSSDKGLNTTLTAINPESFSLGKATFKSNYPLLYSHPATNDNPPKADLDKPMVLTQNPNQANQRIALYKTNEKPSGTYTPPILRVSPGDTIKLKLDNQLTGQWSGSAPQDTNFHYHGFNVPATENADNVLIHVHPEQSDQMDFEIPKNHQPGLYWYHPHVHDDSDSQILSGLSGGIIVNGIEKNYPIINGIPLFNRDPLKQDKLEPLTERVILFKDLQLIDTTGTRYTCYTLNGLVNPKISIQPGEVQFWRIGNIGADYYINLSLEKAPASDPSNPDTSAPKNLDAKKTQPFYILARDSNVVNHPFAQDQILLAPGNRVEVLVIGDPSGQQYNLVSKEVLNTDYNPNSIPQTSRATFVGNPIVATVLSQGKQVNYDIKVSSQGEQVNSDSQEALKNYILSQRPQDKSDDLPSVDELAKKDIPSQHKRTFTFTQNFANPNKAARGGEFYINDTTYDENHIDTTVRLGDIEEWTLVNATPTHHAFHIHQLDFLVTNVNGKDQPPQGYQDTVDLPPCTTPTDDNDGCKAGVSETVVRIPFTNPLIAAKFVDGREFPNTTTDTHNDPQGYEYDNGKFVGGQFVYHCHLLYHEDHGMMQNILVLPPLPPLDPSAPLSTPK